MRRPSLAEVREGAAGVAGAVVTRLRSWRRARAARRRPGSRRLTWALLGLLAVLLAGIGWCLQDLRPSSPGQEISLDQLGGLADQHRLASAVFRDEDARLEGSYSAQPVVTLPATGSSSSPAGSTLAGPGADTRAPEGSGRFWVSYQKSDAATAILLGVLSRADAAYSVDPQTAKAEVRLVTTFLLPLMVLATLFALLFSLSRGGGAGIGEVVTFGTIGQRRLRRGQVAPVTFADVAGAEEAVAELSEVRDYLADPRRFAEIGAQPPKGVLLIGPPGCGKTLLAKAVAGEVGVPFFSVAGAEFVESLVGVGAARVRDLFRRVRAAAPAIVFIDELDAAGRRRAVGGGSGGSDEREQTLNQLLVEMDGFEVSSGIVVMGATNRPDILDPALLRPGRFDRHVTIDRPDHLGRTRILELHARGKPLGAGVDLDELGRRTPGFSGADLANVVNEAALLALRQQRSEILRQDLEEAVQRVLAGPSRRGRVLTAEERRRAAYHEGAHAVVAAATGRAGEVHRVSILARGRSVGSAALHRDDDSALITRVQLRGRIVTLLAGVAAEELVYGEPSTGAETDLRSATDLARDMVVRWGMSRRLGRFHLRGAQVDEFLDGETPLAEVSEATHQAVDEEIMGLLGSAEAEATRLLRERRDLLDHIAALLVEEETLEGPSLDPVLAEVAVDPAFAVGDGAEMMAAERGRWGDAAAGELAPV